MLGDQDGREVWEFEGARFTQVGMNAMAGRRPETMRLEPSRFSEMRPGCYDIDARIHDMDINGVWASLNFPSSIRAAHQRAVALEHRCRMAWMVDAVGGGPGLPEPIVERFAQSDGNGFLGFWEAMARRVLRAEPELLDWQPGRTR